MNKYYLYIIIVGIGFVGCSPKSVPTSGKQIEEKEVTSNTSELEYQYTFTEANKQLLFSNIKQAVLLFNKCVELDSTRAMPYYQLANIYYRAGDPKNALSYCKNAYKYDSGNEWINKLLVELYRLNDQVPYAIEVIQKSISDDPHSIELQFTLASLLHESEKSKKALEVLNSIEKQFGVSEQVSLSKHQIYSELGKNDDAEKTLLDLIGLNPSEYRFQGMLAEFYSSTGNNEAAESIYNNLIKENADNPLIVLSAAEHYVNIKKYDKAKKLYEDVLLDKDFDTNNKIRTIIGLITKPAFFNSERKFIGDIIDKNVEQGGNDVKLLTLRADFNIRTGNYEKAEKDLKYVLEKDKSNFVMWEQFLYVNNMQNDNETLLDYSVQALNYFPGHPNLYLFKGLAEMNLSKYDKSLSSFKAGLKLTKENKALELQFMTFLGDVYRNMGNDKKSDEYFEKVLEIDPENMIVLNNYSYYLSLREEKLDKAEKFSKKTIDKEPNNSTYLDTYAWILFKLSKYDDAKKYIERAIKNSGSGNSEILGHYGDILEKLKDYENAVKYWKLAIEKGGDKESIQKKINNVLQYVNEK